MPSTPPAPLPAQAANFRWYLAGVGAWFTAYAMLLVLFPWLVVIELHESPERVGIAQMALMLPTLLFVLICGVLADRIGPRRVIVAALAACALPPLLLAAVIGAGWLDYAGLILFALAMGVAQSFVTPAREALLPQVVVGSIQRTVTAVTGVMFGVQMLGFFIAGLADLTGALPLLLVQVAITTFGALAFLRLRLPAWDIPPRSQLNILASFIDSYGTVLGFRALRPVMAINLAVGLAFMGAFMVGIPLLIRELHAGTPAQIAAANIANMAGVTASVLVLLRVGGIRRCGRALLCALFSGAATIGLLALPMPYWAMLVLIFAWGLGGGVSITMGRTLVQEMAPPAYRSRVMALYILAFMGGAPLGSLAMGYIIDWLGPLDAMLVPAIGMAALCLAVGWRTELWRLQPPFTIPVPKEAAR
jgi:MFS family permease